MGIIQQIAVWSFMIHTALLSQQSPSHQPVRAIFYAPGVMDTVMHNHMNPEFPPGDYVPSLRPRPEADCRVAVNWGVKHYVKDNTLLVMSFYNPKLDTFMLAYCQAVDWEAWGDASAQEREPYLSRIELDYKTARRVGVWPNNSYGYLVVAER